MKERNNERLLRQKQELFDRWQDVEAALAKSREDGGDSFHREPFLEQVNRLIKEKGCDYVAVIHGLDESWSARGTKWLQGIVDAVNEKVLELLPSFKGEVT